MVSPTIALRFRDTTPGIDTVAAHREILQRTGEVWWGWWKKDFEDERFDLLRNITARGSVDVLIVDRSTSRMFRATAAEVKVGKGVLPDLAKVPSYYREKAKQVFGWFLLKSLATTEFVDGIAERFGDGTLISLAEEQKVAATVSLPTTGRNTILHLSDLHFGPEYDFAIAGAKTEIGNPRKTLTQCLREDLERLGLLDDIAAILVTGDTTSGGDWNDRLSNNIIEEFKALLALVKLETSSVIFLPGNHDIVRYPNGSDVNVAELAVDNQTTYKHEHEFRLFIDKLLDRSWKAPLNYVQRLSLPKVDVILAVLNSCRILATEWTEYGYVGPSGLDVIKALGREAIKRPTVKIVALHHHLIPVTDVEVPKSKGVTLSLDAAKILETAQSAGVQVAVHGHQHVPRLVRYQSVPLMGGKEEQPILIVSNGSTGISPVGRPAGERNTYCLFTFSEDDVSLKMRELRPDGRPGAELFGGPLRVTPLGK